MMLIRKAMRIARDNSNHFLEQYTGYLNGSQLIAIGLNNYQIHHFPQDEFATHVSKYWQEGF
jgi:hypothetical protein